MANNRHEKLDSHIAWLQKIAKENPQIGKEVKKIIDGIEALKPFGNLTTERQRQESIVQLQITSIARIVGENQTIARIMEDIMLPIW